MKKLKIITLLIPLLLAGCNKDSENCPPKTNATISFNLKDVVEKDVFSALVGNVELFIYDVNGILVSRTSVSESELKQFAGKRLKLNPGTYTIVAWANATPARTSFVTDDGRNYLDRANNYLLTAIATGGIVEDGDPLYYAPKANGTPLRVTVPAVGNVEVNVEMRNAHVKMEVTVEGYEHITRAAADPLKVEITNLTSRYSFGMEAHGNKVSYIKYAPNTDTEKKEFYTRFNIPVFDRNTETQIRVTNNKGDLIVSAISLKGLLGSKIDPETLWHLPIRIVFSEEDGFFRADVKVDLPEWNEEEVKPSV